MVCCFNDDYLKNEHSIFFYFNMIAIFFSPWIVSVSSKFPHIAIFVFLDLSFMLEDSLKQLVALDAWFQNLDPGHMLRKGKDSTLGQQGKWGQVEDGTRY